MSRVRFLITIPSVKNAAGARDIHIAPLLAAISTDNGVTSLRVRNLTGRREMLTLEIKRWECEAGLSVLADCSDVFAAQTRLVVGGGEEKVISLAIGGCDYMRESAYRLFLTKDSAAVVGDVPQVLIVETAPLFITPVGARAQVSARLAETASGDMIEIYNTGNAHAEILALTDDTGARIAAPRFLIAGARLSFARPPFAQTVRILTTDIDYTRQECVLRLDGAEGLSSTVATAPVLSPTD